MQIIILLLFLLKMELQSTPQLFAYESVLLFSESFLQPVENEKRKLIYNIINMKNPFTASHNKDKDEKLACE